MYFFFFIYNKPTFYLPTSQVLTHMDDNEKVSLSTLAMNIFYHIFLDALIKHSQEQFKVDKTLVVTNLISRTQRACHLIYCN